LLLLGLHISVTTFMFVSKLAGWGEHGNWKATEAS
jgi:hypothetical protein